MKYQHFTLLALALMTTACGDNNNNICIQQIENAAQYGYENEISKKICDTSNIQFFSLAGRVQNGFGAWRKAEFSCIYNKASKEAMVFENELALAFANLPADKRNELCQEFDQNIQPEHSPAEQDNVDILDEITIFILNIKTLYANRNGHYDTHLTNDLCAKVGVLPSSVKKTGTHLTNQLGHTIDVVGHETYFTLSYSGISPKVCNILQNNYHQVQFIYDAKLNLNSCNDCQQNDCTLTLFVK